MVRKKHPKKPSSFWKRLKQLFLVSFFPLLLIIGLTFESSNILNRIADLLVVKNQIPMAGKLYQLSQTLNPWNKSTSTRLLALTETADESTNHEETTEKQAVLGYANMVEVPVLMYHYIRVNPDPGDTKGFDLSVTPYMFAKQMDYLKEHGYHTISLDEFGSNLLYHVALPSKPIVLTFDDSYRDFYTAAYPILKERGMKGVNFVITGFVDYELPRYLTWDQIAEMEKSGLITFEDHTINHAVLTAISDTSLTREISDSKKDLEKHLGYPVNWIAYPGGNFNQHVADLTQQAGYIGGFTTKPGYDHSPDNRFMLPRVRVSGGDSLESFAAKLPWQ